VQPPDYSGNLHHAVNVQATVKTHSKFHYSKVRAFKLSNFASSSLSMAGSLTRTNPLFSNYRKHYIPLESNPAVFTQLIRHLGVSNLEFQDVYSIDDPDMLALISRPVLALVLLFPTTEVYEKQVAEEEARRQEYAGCGDDEDVIWFRQTINNACGLYGILHSVCNGNARKFIRESY
jgi:hypothetical protein